MLVADDNKDSRELYDFALSRVGFDVAMAGDGEQALAKAMEILPHCLVLDLHMPLLGGIEVIRRLRANDRTRHLPALALSGDPSSKGSALVAGFDAFCLKPCTPDQILADICRIAPAVAVILSDPGRP